MSNHRPLVLYVPPRHPADPPSDPVTLVHTAPIGPYALPPTTLIVLSCGGAVPTVDLLPAHLQACSCLSKLFSVGGTIPKDYPQPDERTHVTSFAVILLQVHVAIVHNRARQARLAVSISSRRRSRYGESMVRGVKAVAARGLRGIYSRPYEYPHPRTPPRKHHPFLPMTYSAAQLPPHMMPLPPLRNSDEQPLHASIAPFSS